MRTEPHRAHRLGSAAALLPAAVLVYLAFRDGGYPHDVQHQLAIAAWYAIFLGLVLGFLPRARIGRETLVTGVLIASFAGWTGLSTIWSRSAELSFRAFGLALLYVAVFALVSASLRRGSWRAWMSAIAVGVTAVATLAAVSRIVPQWFPEDTARTLLADAQARLSYPIAYWNALAFLVAAGVPVLLHFAAAARTPRMRSLATAAVPVCGLTLYMTYSRGGLLAVAIAVALYLTLSPWRRAVVIPAAVAGAGVLVLVLRVKASPEFAEGLLTTDAARSQGHVLFVVALATTAIVYALSRLYAGRRGREGLPDGPRRQVPRGAVAIGVAAASLLLVTAFATGAVDRAWHDFKDPEIATVENPDDVGAAQQRLSSGSGHGRYQFWEVSFESFKRQPIFGTGAATWEFTWAQHGEFPYYVRNAHSLPMDVLAELGLVGGVLIITVLGYPLWIGARRFRSASAESRAAAAALLAVTVALTIGFAVDWIWKVPATAALWFVAVALLAGMPVRDESKPDGPRGRVRYASGALVMAFAWVAIAAEVIPLISHSKVESSQQAVREGDLDRAAADARSAQAVEPWAVQPDIQEGLVEMRRGDQGAAIAAAHRATRREPHDWRNWVILARFYFKANAPNQAKVTLSVGRVYNPRTRSLQESTYLP